MRYKTHCYLRILKLHTHKPEKKKSIFRKKKTTDKIHIRKVRVITQRDKMHGSREWEKEKEKQKQKYLFPAPPQVHTRQHPQEALDQS